MRTDVRSAQKVRAVTKGPNVLPDGPCIALRCSEDGVLNITDCTGTDINDFPVFKGDNPISVQKIRAGGASIGIWALYNDL